MNARAGKKKGHCQKVKRNQYIIKLHIHLTATYK